MLATEAPPLYASSIAALFSLGANCFALVMMPVFALRWNAVPPAKEHAGVLHRGGAQGYLKLHRHAPSHSITFHPTTSTSAISRMATVRAWAVMQRLLDSQPCKNTRLGATGAACPRTLMDGAPPVKASLLKAADEASTWSLYFPSGKP